MDDGVLALKASLRPLTPYNGAGNKAKAHRRAVLVDLMRTLLVNDNVDLRPLPNGDFLVACGGPGWIYGSQYQKCALSEKAVKWR